MNLLKDDELMKTVSDIGPCYGKLGKEFILNISNECKVEESKEFRKVYIRGCYVKFSPEIINEYLWRSKTKECDEVPSIDKVEKERSKKCMLSSGRLRVKYAMLNMIGAAK